MEEEGNLHAMITFEECPKLCDEPDEVKPQAGNLINVRASTFRLFPQSHQ